MNSPSGGRGAGDLAAWYTHTSSVVKVVIIPSSQFDKFTKLPSGSARKLQYIYVTGSWKTYLLGTSKPLRKLNQNLFSFYK